MVNCSGGNIDRNREIETWLGKEFTVEEWNFIEQA